MKAILNASIKTIVYVCIIAIGMFVFFGIAKGIDFLIESDYGIQAALGFIILVFNYIQAHKEQMEPQ